MLKPIPILLVLILIFIPTGCVGLFYAKDFSFQEFVQDHIKDPVQSISHQADIQDPTRAEPANSEKKGS